MAGIGIGMPFSPMGTFPIDERVVLTKAEMVAADDTKMPDIYFALCKEDGKMYVYKKGASASAETGRYSVLESDGSGDYTSILNKPQINNTVLEGNKSFEDLGDVPISNEEIKKLVDEQYAAVFGS